MFFLHILTSALVGYLQWILLPSLSPSSTTKIKIRVLKSYFTFLYVFFPDCPHIDTVVLKHPWLVPLGSCGVWSTCQSQDAGDGPLGRTAQAVPVASGSHNRHNALDHWHVGWLTQNFQHILEIHHILFYEKSAILRKYDQFVIGSKLFSEFVLEDFGCL